MTRTLIHRGPDDEGYYFNGPLGFGFRRLSIIDLGGGHQPMSDGKNPFGWSSTAKSTTSLNSGVNWKVTATFSAQNRTRK